MAVDLRPLVCGRPSRVQCLALGTFRPSLTLPCLTLSRCVESETAQRFGFEPEEL